jgi:hypothetical protein
MGLIYEAQKGRRCKRAVFCWVSGSNSYYWSRNGKCWVHWDSPDKWRFKDDSLSSSCDLRIKTVRAFRRKLREWSHYLPSGIKFTLESRYKGLSVYGQTRGQNGNAS